MTILYIIILILILGIIIFIHELGHFFFAKKFGVFIYEFSIGMGPVIYTKKGKDGINYNVRAIPIGGFVQMAGEVYEDDDLKKIPKEKFMCNKKWYQRVIILVAGVVNNYLLAIFLLFVLALCFDVSISYPVIDSLSEEYPAYTSGLEEGDTILSINDHTVNSWDGAQIILAYEDEDNIYDFVVETTEGDIKEISITPEVVEEDGVSYNVFGISIKTEEVSGVIDSIKYAFTKFATIIESLFLTLYALFSGNIGVNALSGPIGMYEVVEVAAVAGLANIIYLLAYLSINVGILNILPFPAFDGGRVLFLLIEKIKGSPVNSNIENWFHTIGFVLLILLSIYVAFNDIIRMFF